MHGKAQYDERRLDARARAPARHAAIAIHDVIFQPASGRKYVFTVAVMDNSEAEHLGSEPQTLTFDPKGGLR